MTLRAPLIVGCVMIASMVPVQALAITLIVRIFRRQVAAWAVLFFGCGEFDDFSTAFYHSAVNFTTLALVNREDEI